jgi:hypothetical protein
MNSSPRTPSIVKPFSLAVALVVSLSLLAGCSSARGFLSREETLAIAEELSAIKMAGFSFGEIYLSCDAAVACPSTNDQAFKATPISGNLDPSTCTAIHDWVNQNLTDVVVDVSYNITDLNQSVYGCESVLPTDWGFALHYAGFRDGTLIQVFNEPENLIINIDSSGIKSTEGFFNEYSTSVMTSSILNSLAELRLSEGLEYFSEAQVQAAIDEHYASETVDPELSITWEAESVDKISQIYVEITPGTLLPFCLSLEPWNTAKYGDDPGPNYISILRNSPGMLLENFGHYQTGECLPS